jgi:ferredoxin-NADP reductase/predicted pyridoxine 5'-phosphate oxidase superfamily flavin-nucleotide-binding protein
MSETKELKASPFHKGEIAVQNRMGVRDRMEKFGRQVIRDHMLEQHRDFFQQLPFVFVGHSDTSGWPWASILFGDANLIHSPDPKTLDIEAMPVVGDPLSKSLQQGVQLGLLGLDLPTRRRNRLSAHVLSCKSLSPETTKLRLRVDQSFGNCPQYIQTRDMQKVDPISSETPTVQELSEFDDEAMELIRNSDTFLVASSVAGGSGEASEGADVSHRGGRPGFIRVDNTKTLTIPDFIGNNHFNTFGNFVENPRAGLLFIDFERGHILTVTGTVEMIWDSPEIEHFEGAQRLWKFHLDHGRWLKHGLPFRLKFGDFSQNTLLTGTWSEAELRMDASQQLDAWSDYVVRQAVDESSVIKSFYLSAKDGLTPKFKPGQFLTIKMLVAGKQLIRTYTVSSAPADPLIRISIKRETASELKFSGGEFSNFMHDHINIGDVVEVKQPRGPFFFDASEERPAVLLAAGVGITPMVSMLRHVLIEGVRTRHMRQTVLVSSAKTSEQRPFFDELNAISAQSNGFIRHYSLLSEVDNNLEQDVDYHGTGRISAPFLQSILPLDDYDFYLCGPSGFMQSMYDMLNKIGVSDSRVFAEEFGPAALQRSTNVAVENPDVLPEAKEAIIRFSDSGVEQAWVSGDGNLLEFAEAHGFSPEYGCRSGQCGACKVKLIAGAVVYKAASALALEDDEVLLCCASPAQQDDEGVPTLTLGL